MNPESKSAVPDNSFSESNMTMKASPVLRGWLQPAVCLVLTVGALALATTGAFAQPTPNPPERMTYQGFLVDGNGVALGNTAPQNYDVIFRIHTDQTAGVVLWGEQQTVTVDKGYFSVLLGEGADAGSPRPALSTLFKGPTASERYVGITVKGIGAGGANVDILPRLRLLTSPYSFLAQNAVKLVQDTGADLITSSGNSVTIGGSVSANSFTGSGSGLTGLNASQLSSGAIPDARLSANVARRDVGNTFTGDQVTTGHVRVGHVGNSTLGTPGYGKALIFSGAPDVSPGFDNDNSDPLWISRFNSGDNQSELRIAIGDDPGSHTDKLVIGTMLGSAAFTQGGTWGPLFGMDARGFMGVGTGSPEARLHVHSGSILNDNGSTFQSRNSVGAIENFLWPRWTDNIMYLNYGANGFSIRNNSSAPVMFMQNNGYVGVGTTAPSHRLTVEDGDPRIRVRFPGGGSYMEVGRTANQAFIGLNNSVHQAGFRWASYDGDSNWDFFSDRALKKDIVDAEPMLERALKVQIRRYRWKEDESDAVHKLGVVAQELQPLFPEMVSELENPSNGEKNLGVGYSDFGVVAIKALQEFKAQHDAEMSELKAQMAEIVRENAALRARLDKGTASTAGR